MILLVDSEGLDQTAQADLGLHCPHMPEDTFSHAAAHLIFNGSFVEFNTLYAG